MVRNTTAVPGELHDVANEERILGAELTGATLDDTRYVEIWSQQGNKKTAYGAGLGPKNRDYAEGYGDLDIQNAGAAPSDGKLRWEVYDDPEKENLIAYSSTFRSERLRAAVSSATTDKPVFPAVQPLAGEDSYVVLAMKADSGSDGDVIDAGNSTQDIGLPYSRYK